MCTKRLPYLMLAGWTLLASACYSEKNGWDNPADRYADAYEAYLNASQTLGEDRIGHFVFFARDREKVTDHPFLDIEAFDGAQIMYSWRQLEPEPGVYDFSEIEEDLAYLQSRGKKLFIQLQDATFHPDRQAVPDYLLSGRYDGGAVLQRDDDGVPEGWVAKRWNRDVQRRFALLLSGMGREFDGEIEGINLQESAIGVSEEYDDSFTPELYVEGLKTNMAALKKAFPQSVTMQYANFMPGEWLPWEDQDYLRSIYAYGEEIGVGLGGPDLMVQRRGQLNHTIAMMHEGDFTVPLGIAVQDGNYIAKTGADKDYFEVAEEINRQKDNLVPMLHDFAEDFMGVSYMFWSYQEPYFSEDVIPYFSEE